MTYHKVMGTDGMFNHNIRTTTVNVKERGGGAGKNTTVSHHITKFYHTTYVHDFFKVGSLPVATF